MKEGKSFSTKNDIPTSIDWMGANKFLWGYTNNYKIALYDAESGAQSKEYMFSPNNKNSQVNKLLYT